MMLRCYHEMCTIVTFYDVALMLHYHVRYIFVVVYAHMLAFCHHDNRGKLMAGRLEHGFALYLFAATFGLFCNALNTASIRIMH